jgi:hypothetical protein
MSLVTITFRPFIETMWWHYLVEEHIKWRTSALLMQLAIYASLLRSGRTNFRSS